MTGISTQFVDQASKICSRLDIALVNVIEPSKFMPVVCQNLSVL